MKSSVLLPISFALVFLILSSPSVIHAQVVTDLYDFANSHGLAGPGYVTPTQGRDGNMYGTASGLATGRSSDGAVFRYTIGGPMTATYTFSNSGQTDGGGPSGGLTIATDGHFYGSTFRGGESNAGVLFKVARNGTYTLIHNFDGDGAYLIGAPVEASDGNLYGTTGYNTNIAGGYGTVYRYTRAGVFSTIYNFSSTDGANPWAPLIQAADGNLYGTTSQGGAHNCGTIFKMTTSGTLMHSYSFKCGADGAYPYGYLMQASDGNFYGITTGDFVTSFGTVFKLAQSGVVSTIYAFPGATFDGQSPLGGLVQGTDGNLYGTTQLGGTDGNGTIFQVTLSGAYTSLYSFPTSVGAQPWAPPRQHTSGVFYGTTFSGGAGGDGSFYSLDMGLGPFVTFVRPTGKVAQTAQILGQGLTGTTSVTFNGLAATSFSVVSDTYMTAVVPADATTGPVVVATPSGQLTSNVNFRISK